ncbi:MAG: helix-turn-helix transcriptional regulator [Solirubrobacteraceae bacterium]
MRAHTIHEQQRLRLLAGAMIARHYRRPLTLAGVARALSSSPRQLQRAYTRVDSSFSEDLLAVRMSAAVQLLVEHPSIPVADVARLIGYSRATHFARAFRRCFGVTPAVFRERERSARAEPRALA